MSTESQVTTIDDTPEKTERTPRGSRSKSAEATLSGSHVMLTIHPSSEDGGSAAVFIGHNGNGYQIPRGKPFKVPKEVAEIVENALVTTYKPGAAGRQVETTVPRFAYSIQPA